jgi:hypothetical protein
MIVRIAKGIWLVSMMGSVAVLLYAYASLPEVIQWREVGEGVSRNAFFYAALGLLAVFNMMVFLVNRFMASGDEFFQAWFYGLVVFFNLFTVVSLQFFNLYNSAEKFNYESIGYIIYGSVVLMLAWVAVWPIARAIKLIRPKQPVG